MFLAALVLLLVGLFFPITLLLAAVLLDIGVLIWALYRTWTDRVLPHFARVLGHGLRPVHRPGHAIG